MRKFMNDIRQAIAKAFANQIPAAKVPALEELSGLDAPGVGVKKPASIVPVIDCGLIETPASAPSIDQPAPAARCKECGQVLPVAPVVEEVVTIVDQVSTGP